MHCDTAFKKIRMRVEHPTAEFDSLDALLVDLIIRSGPFLRRRCVDVDSRGSLYLDDGMAVEVVVEV